MVAGEASGDALGAGLIRALRRRCGQLTVYGVGGPKMTAEGLTSHFPMERLSVMGLVEVLGRYPEVVRLRRRLAEHLEADPPDVFVGIDAPDFNIALEARLRHAGIPTVQYVSPQVWAWRRYRLPKIARAVDRMLTLFPFEEEFYRSHGVPVRYVGHPLGDAIPMNPDRAEARRLLGLAQGAEVVALLPGSRSSEVTRLCAPMVETARWLLARRPGLEFLLPTASAGTATEVSEVLARSGGDLPIRLLEGRARLALTACNVALLASGTASLEAMLLKRPMVVTYRTHPLTFRIMKAMFTVDRIALPNLLAGGHLVPELLQGDAVPEKLGPAVLALLQAGGDHGELLATFARIHEQLRRNGDSAAAHAVMEVVQSPQWVQAQ